MACLSLLTLFRGSEPGRTKSADELIRRFGAAVDRLFSSSV
jgi:hypothetical protein